MGMKVNIFPSESECGMAAAKCGAEYIRRAQKRKASGIANIIVATGQSQYPVYKQLIQEPGIDWSKVNIFHLDEYIGLPEDHSACFRRYLRDRFVDLLPCPPMSFNPVSGDGLIALNKKIAKFPIDLAFIGVGNNGHIAFNDPPADFDIETPYIVVTLAEACRQQQLGQKWFKTFDDVPTHAVSMSVKQILKSKAIINTVQGQHKAAVMKAALEGRVTKMCPASILQTHPNCHIFLDTASASKLKRK